MRSNRSLLAITTANQVEYTSRFVDSLLTHLPQNIDLLIVDDASIDNTIDYCLKNKIPYISKQSSKGLTHSWNIAYEKFKWGGYKNLYISNNDILIPKGALESLEHGLEIYTMVGPLTNKKSVPYHAHQYVKKYYNKIDVDDDPQNFQRIQSQIGMNKNSYFEVEQINGFFFGLNRRIIEVEYSSTELFDPINTNVDNEVELCNKLDGGKAICLNSFIFHFKGVSFETFKTEDGYLLDRNLTWYQARNIGENKIKLLFYRLKRKIKTLLK